MKGIKEDFFFQACLRLHFKMHMECVCACVCSSIILSGEHMVWRGNLNTEFILFQSKGKETLWEVQFFVIYLGFLGREVISAINQTIYMCLTCYSLTL